MYSADGSSDAVFMVQPEEMACYKSLRRVVDKVFTADDRFLVSSVVYTDMDSAEDGVNRHLRSMLFVPSKKTRRGVRRVESADKSINESNLPAVKQAQRQSKQKERCESRLMSLLFATIYDPATKRCRLVQDVPPLKLVRLDKNGKARKVSNYTDVRLYLRNSMASILSAYSESVKVLSHMLPHIFGVLPVLFTVIARTLMVIIKIDHPGDENEDFETVRRKASDALEYCMASIQNFITTWERRNFSTDNPLLHCLKAGVNNECYDAVRKLLESMISVLPPTGREPYDDHFRQQNVYEHALPNGIRCKKIGDRQCFHGDICAAICSKGRPVPDMSKYLHYIDCLTKCARSHPATTLDVVDAMISENEFSVSMWDYCEGLGLLHGMESMLVDNRSEEHQEGKNQDCTSPIHAWRVHQDVAKCWSALGRSNVRTWHLLNDLNIENSDVLKETAVELIFGGAMAAIALFERERDIIPICANLRSKKGPMVVRMSDDLSDMEVSNEEALINEEDMPRPMEESEKTNPEDAVAGAAAEKPIPAEEPITGNEPSVENGDECQLSRIDEDDGNGNKELHHIQSAQDEHVDSPPSEIAIMKANSFGTKYKRSPSRTAGDEESVGVSNVRVINKKRKKKRRGTMSETVEAAKTRVLGPKQKLRRMRKQRTS